MSQSKLENSNGVILEFNARSRELEAMIESEAVMDLFN